MVDFSFCEGYSGWDLTLPPYRYEALNINGTMFDLRIPTEIQKAKQLLTEYRADLRTGELDKYEGKSTELFSGGRSKLRYDELRIQIAEDGCKGKHSLEFEEQHQEVKRLQELERLRFTK
jgi:hypothetical protein